MIQLMSNGYFDLFMLTADMYLGTKNMDKVHIRASIKTTLLIPPPPTTKIYRDKTFARLRNKYLYPCHFLLHKFVDSKI